MHNKRRANFHVNRQSTQTNRDTTHTQTPHTYTDTITYLGQLPKMCSIPFWGRFQHYLHLAIRFSVWTFCCLAFSAFFILSVCFSSSGSRSGSGSSSAFSTGVLCAPFWGAASCSLASLGHAATSKLASLCPRLTPCLLFSAFALLFMRCPATHTKNTHTETHTDIRSHTYKYSFVSHGDCISYLLSASLFLCCVSCGPCVYAYQLLYVFVCVWLRVCVFVCFVCACCSLVARGAFMMCA